MTQVWWIYKIHREDYNYYYSFILEKDSMKLIALALFSIQLVVRYSLEVSLSMKLWLFTIGFARGKRQRYQFFRHVNLGTYIKGLLKRLMRRRLIERKDNLFNFLIILSLWIRIFRNVWIIRFFWSTFSCKKPKMVK